MVPAVLMLPVLAAGTSIIVAGKPVDVGRPVVLWSDPEGFDGYSQNCLEQRAMASSKCCQSQFNRFGKRKNLKSRDLPSLKEVLTQFVLHLDGCVNSRSCFYSMHDTARPDGGCGLSAHFMVDADGTIYQTLDLLESAWHAEQANSVSVGVEICNRGDAGRNELDRLPAEYRTRPVKDVVINGRTIHAFDFRPEQYESVIALARTLVRLFPNIKPIYPERDGAPLLETLRDPLSFHGIVGHLHVDLQKHKWDPGAFDWSRLLRALHGFYFPIAVRGFLQIPEERSALQAATKALFRNTEERATGFFPVGPGGLWHSGVHLRGVAGEPVYVPVRGRIVAARSSPAAPGASFVLIRHDVEVDKTPFAFYSLLAHLTPFDIGEQSRSGWVRELVRLQDVRALQALRAGETALLDLRVEAGEVIGSLGQVRRGFEQGAELHFETFSPDKPPPALARAFRFVGAAADGAFARQAPVVDAVDVNGDHQIRAEELTTFFREGDLQNRQALRHFAVRHQHEWGDRLRESAFVSAPELRSIPEDDRRRLFQTALAPYVFWNNQLTQHTGLPSSQVVYSYHPVTMLVTLAATASKVELHWPARAPLPDHELESAAVVSGVVSDWLVPQNSAQADGPIFGPVTDSQVASRKRNDIPLIILPNAQE